MDVKHVQDTQTNRTATILPGIVIWTAKNNKGALQICQSNIRPRPWRYRHNHFVELVSRAS